MIAVAAAFVVAAWSGAGTYRTVMTDGPTRAVAATEKRVDNRRRFEAGTLRGTELVAYRDSLEQIQRSNALAAQRATETAAALAAGRPDPYRPVIRSTPSYGGGPSYGK